MYSVALMSRNRVFDSSTVKSIKFFLFRGVFRCFHNNRSVVWLFHVFIQADNWSHKRSNWKWFYCHICNYSLLLIGPMTFTRIEKKEKKKLPHMFCFFLKFILQKIKTSICEYPQRVTFGILFSVSTRRMNHGNNSIWLAKKYLWAENDVWWWFISRDPFLCEWNLRQLYDNSNANI